MYNNYWLNGSHDLQISKLNNGSLLIKKDGYETICSLSLEIEDYHNICAHCDVTQVVRMNLEFSQENFNLWCEKSWLANDENERKKIANSLKRTIITENEFNQIAKEIHLNRKKYCPRACVLT